MIKEYLEFKEVYNNYLETSDSFYIQIPYHNIAKSTLTDDSSYSLTVVRSKESLFNYILDNTKSDIYYADDTIAKTVAYEVAKIPNNLDVYNKTTKSYGGLKDLHNGLELVIIPAVAKYYTTDYCYSDGDRIIEKTETDFTNCLYCLYFRTKEVIDDFSNLNRKYKAGVFIISYLEALNLIKESNNTYLHNLAINIMKELEEAVYIEEVEALAEEYNTGNVIALTEKPVEEVKPIKLTTYNNRYSITQHDKELLDRISEVEAENKKLVAMFNKYYDLKEPLKDNLKEAIDDYKETKKE